MMNNEMLKKFIENHVNRVSGILTQEIMEENINNARISQGFYPLDTPHVYDLPYLGYDLIESTGDTDWEEADEWSEIEWSDEEGGMMQAMKERAAGG